MSDVAPIEARGLLKTYGHVTAVDNVDLTVERGDVYGFLGPNGAGKTTTLRMLLGLIRPDSGEARLFGRDPLKEGARALDGVAGFVEAPRFYPYMTGRRNLDLVAALDAGDARGRIDDALHTVELFDRASDKVGGYSHGMRQRLGIAGALIRDPSLLILDEPTTGLDPAGMRDMKRLVRRLADQGLTVLLSSHIMDEVEELCDRLAIVRSGRVIYEGRLDELLHSTGQRYGLRTTDDRRALEIATHQPGVGDVRREDDGSLEPGRGRVGGRRTVDRARAGRAGHPRARAGRGQPRGAVLPPDRGRRARRAAGLDQRREPRGGQGMTAAALPARAARRPGTWTVYKWELRKLRSQKRTYLGLGAAVVVPCIFIVALMVETGGPERVPFGRYVRETGLAIPLVLLLFGSIWLFPLIVSLVAGDIVAAEDRNGTLKTILTRSVERHQIFIAKVLAAFTYAVAALLLFAAVAAIFGGLRFGFHPLTTLSGTKVGVGHGLILTGGALLAYLMPVLAVACIALLLSTVTRNSAAAIVGALMISLIMQLLGIISGLEFLRPYLLSTQFDAWQGLLRDPIDWDPIGRAAWVCAAYAVPALGAALTVFVRRDVAGG